MLHKMFRLFSPFSVFFSAELDEDRGRRKNRYNERNLKAMGSWERFSSAARSRLGRLRRCSHTLISKTPLRLIVVVGGFYDLQSETIKSVRGAFLLTLQSSDLISILKTEPGHVIIITHFSLMWFPTPRNDKEAIENPKKMPNLCVFHPKSG